MRLGKIAGACAWLVVGVWAVFAGRNTASAAPYVPGSEAAVLCAVSPAHNDIAALRQEKVLGQ